MPEPARDYYFDTVTLSNFALVHRLDLLVARYGRRLRVTQEVLGEVIDGIVSGYSGLAAIEAAVNDGDFGSAEPLSTGERRAFQRLLRALAPGEASCIVCAKARKGVVATDDRLARDCCAAEGVPFTGTIGILKACCAAGTLAPQAADDLLQAMIAAGYHAPVSRISGLL
jgi:predicted nucleic acid-binding protein